MTHTNTRWWMRRLLSLFTNLKTLTISSWWVFLKFISYISLIHFWQLGENLSPMQWPSACPSGACPPRSGVAWHSTRIRSLSDTNSYNLRENSSLLMATYCFSLGTGLEGGSLSCQKPLLFLQLKRELIHDGHLLLIVTSLLKNLSSWAAWLQISLTWLFHTSSTNSRINMKINFK